MEMQLTNEEPETADTAFDEYMAMDANEWLEPDIYENGETPVVGFNGKEDSSQHDSGPDSRGQKREELKKEKPVIDKPHQNTRSPTTAPPSIPLTDITIRRPPMNANGGLRVVRPLGRNGPSDRGAIAAPQTAGPPTAPQTAGPSRPLRPRGRHGPSDRGAAHGPSDRGAVTDPQTAGPSRPSDRGAAHGPSDRGAAHGPSDRGAAHGP
ncbi:RNA polymerase-associated protein CTR9 like [Dissostichus eleginoides]|uniref:RNA polymerase-associated protein CTR9 like n=1 Tax=Dissostichus eleginoides TaxID=100907 RepID=A0AAD9C363_DISEL|nr:RNA polymerase-associated protein CTR9 like [Dissostichus eleginoides]